MKRGGLFISILICWTLSFAQNRNINYSASTGLPQEFIYTLGEDEKGLIWAGTGKGLTTFDGVGFSVFDTTDGLAEDFVTSMYWEGEKVVMGHLKGGVTIREKDKFERINLDVPCGRVLKIVRYGNNFLLNTRKKGLIWANKNGKTKVLKGYNRHMIYDLLRWNEDSFYVATNKGLYLQVDTHLTERVYDGRVFSLNKFNKELVVGSSSGIFNWNNLERIRWELEVEIPAIYQRQTTIIRIKNGHLYGFIPDKGIWIINLTTGHMSERLLDHPQFFNIYVNDFFVDLEENVWVATDGFGLTIFFNDWLDKHLSYPKTEFVSLFTNGDKLFFGLDHKVFEVFESAEKLRLNLVDTLESSLQIKDVYVDDKGTAWCGTETGLYFMKQGDQKWLNSLGDKLKGVYISDLNYYLGYVWISTIGHGIYRVNPKTETFENFNAQTGMLHNDITRSYGDSKGRIWLATRATKLTSIDTNGRVEIVDLPDNETSLNISSFQESKNGDLWISTDGDGLWKFMHDTLYSVPATGLKHSHSLFEKDGELWVGVNKKLTRIRVDDYTFHSFDELDNIKHLDFFPNSFASLHNQIIIAGSDGLYTLNTEHKDYNVAAIPLYVKNLVLNGDRVNSTSELNLDPGSYTVGVEVNSLRYNNREALRYQFKIEGDLDIFGEPTKTGKVTYHHLRYGTYKIRARSSLGRKNYGRWQTVLVIHVNTPFWMQWWFVLFAVVSMISAPIMFVRMRVQRLKKNNERLEEEISLRTKEIVEQKDEIENQRDHIAAQQDEIMDSIHYARRIQTAMLVPSDQVMTFSKDFFVFFRPKDIVSGDFFWSGATGSKVIVAAGDCTGHGVPGAFMSMLGISLLNSIVNEQRITKPSEILDHLREGVISSLQQSTDTVGQRDGMDISLICFDTKTKKLEYSGANNSLYILRDGEINQIPADRMPIAIYPKMDAFTNYAVEIKEGDRLYMFSDGYMDQFGGPQGKKFKIRRFKDLLLEIHQKPMNRQHQILKSRLMEWMSYPNEDGLPHEQIDDIVVIGARL